MIAESSFIRKQGDGDYVATASEAPYSQLFVNDSSSPCSGRVYEQTGVIVSCPVTPILFLSLAKYNIPQTSLQLAMTMWLSSGQWGVGKCLVQLAVIPLKGRSRSLHSRHCGLGLWALSCSCAICCVVLQRWMLGNKVPKLR